MDDLVARELVKRAAQGGPLDVGEWAVLLRSDGSQLDDLAAAADGVRREAVGEDLTFVVNRNLDTAVVAAPDADPGLLTELVREAWALGATEVCLQGSLPEDGPFGGYIEVVAAVRAAAPDLHLHAFRPPEVAHAARLAGSTPADFLRAAKDVGLGSVPGTAAQVLDDEVRTRFAGGPTMPVSTWVDLISTAHRVGLRSTATLLYGHGETDEQVVAHLITLVAIQERTGGFTEFIAMPLLPENAPPHLGVTEPPSARRTRAIHAVARLVLRGHVDHVQAAWTKLDDDVLLAVLAGGVDDLGGLLLDGALRPAAGQETGRQLRLSDVERIASAAGRPSRQRTTTYDDPSPERIATARGRLS